MKSNPNLAHCSLSCLRQAAASGHSTNSSSHWNMFYHDDNTFFHPVNIQKWSKQKHWNHLVAIFSLSPQLCLLYDSLCDRKTTTNHLHFSFVILCKCFKTNSSFIILCFQAVALSLKQVNKFPQFFLGSMFLDWERVVEARGDCLWAEVCFYATKEEADGEEQNFVETLVAGQGFPQRKQLKEDEDK